MKHCLFFYKNVPPSKVWKVLYFFVILHLHLAPLKISIHLNISLLASDQGITYHFLHWHTKLVYLVVAARYVRWHLTFSCWITISHFKQHCFLFLLISKICPISQLFWSASVWIKTCICLSRNINKIIYFEIPLFCSPFWTSLKSGKKFFPPSGATLVS